MSPLEVVASCSCQFQKFRAFNIENSLVEVVVGGFVKKEVVVVLLVVVVVVVVVVD